MWPQAAQAPTLGSSGYTKGYTPPMHEQMGIVGPIDKVTVLTGASGRWRRTLGSCEDRGQGQVGRATTAKCGGVHRLGAEGPSLRLVI